MLQLFLDSGGVRVNLAFVFWGRDVNIYMSIQNALTEFCCQGAGFRTALGGWRTWVLWSGRSRGSVSGSGEARMGIWRWTARPRSNFTPRKQRRWATQIQARMPADARLADLGLGAIDNFDAKISIDGFRIFVEIKTLHKQTNRSHQLLPHLFSSSVFEIRLRGIHTVTHLLHLHDHRHHRRTCAQQPSNMRESPKLKPKVTRLYHHHHHPQFQIHTHLGSTSLFFRFFSLVKQPHGPCICVTVFS